MRGRRSKLKGIRTSKLSIRPQLIKRVTGRKRGGLLIQMQNISMLSYGMRRKQNLANCLLPSSFAFLVSLFSFCCVFSRLYFGGKYFWENF